MYKYAGYDRGDHGRYACFFEADETTRKEIDQILLERGWSEFGLCRPNQPGKWYFNIAKGNSVLEVLEYFHNYGQ